MRAYTLRPQWQEELELLAPILSEVDADRCMALGEDFIKNLAASQNQPETSPGPSSFSSDSITSGLLSSLKISLEDRAKTLAMLPADKFASRQLGLDFLTYSGLHESRPFPEADLLKLILTRFHARANYWREVARLLLSESK